MTESILNPTQSKRKVMLEEHILAVVCPKCHAIKDHGCLNKSRYPLAYVLGSTELAFHRERIFEAIRRDQSIKFAGLSIDDKNTLVFYAFIMLCDSVAAKSTKMFDKVFTTEDVQRFFCQAAAEELKKDNLIG